MGTRIQPCANNSVYLCSHLTSAVRSRLTVQESEQRLSASPWSSAIQSPADSTSWGLGFPTTERESDQCPPFPPDKSKQKPHESRAGPLAGRESAWGEPYLRGRARRVKKHTKAKVSTRRRRLRTAVRTRSRVGDSRAILSQEGPTEQPPQPGTLSHTSPGHLLQSPGSVALTWLCSLGLIFGD